MVTASGRTGPSHQREPTLFFLKRSSAKSVTDKHHFSQPLGHGQFSDVVVLFFTFLLNYFIFTIFTQLQSFPTLTTVDSGDFLTSRMSCFRTPILESLYSFLYFDKI